MEAPVLVPGASVNLRGNVLETAPNDGEDLHKQIWRVWRRLRTAAVRGAAAGVTVRGGLHLLSTLLWLLRTSKPAKPGSPRKRELTAQEAILDTARFAAFLAAMGGSYVAVDEGLAMLFGKRRTANWRAAAAGAMAGHAVLLTGPRTRHYSLATYVLLRGLTLLVRVGNRAHAEGKLRDSPVLSALLAPTRMQHGDTALMCLAGSQIIYSYIMMPGTLPASYVRFLSKMVAKDGWVWKAVREQAHANWHGHPPRPLAALSGTPWHQCTGHTPCKFWHGGSSCTGHILSILPATYLRSLGVYFPVYLLPALLVHRQKLLQPPAAVALLPKLATGIARSAAFLTGFVALAFGGACLGFNLTGTSTGPVIAVSTTLGGVATLIEKKSRRMELALYVASRALESCGKCLAQWGVLPAGVVHARLDVMLFAAGCAAIMHCYSDANGVHRSVFKSKYLNVLDFIFGNTGVEAGCITHRPSNRDLLLRGVRSAVRTLSAPRLDALPEHPIAALPEKDGRVHAASNHRWSDAQLTDAAVADRSQSGAAADDSSGGHSTLTALAVGHSTHSTRSGAGSSVHAMNGSSAAPLLVGSLPLTGSGSGGSTLPRTASSSRLAHSSSSGAPPVPWASQGSGSLHGAPTPTSTGAPPATLPASAPAFTSMHVSLLTAAMRQAAAHDAAASLLAPLAAVGTHVPPPTPPPAAVAPPLIPHTYVARSGTNEWSLAEAEVTDGHRAWPEQATPGGDGSTRKGGVRRSATAPCTSRLLAMLAGSTEASGELSLTVDRHTGNGGADDLMYRLSDTNMELRVHGGTGPGTARQSRAHLVGLGEAASSGSLMARATSLGLDEETPVHGGHLFASSQVGVSALAASVSGAGSVAGLGAVQSDPLPRGDSAGGVGGSAHTTASSNDLSAIIPGLIMGHATLQGTASAPVSAGAVTGADGTGHGSDALQVTAGGLGGSVRGGVGIAGGDADSTGPRASAPIAIQNTGGGGAAFLRHSRPGAAYSAAVHTGTGLAGAVAAAGGGGWGGSRSYQANGAALSAALSTSAPSRHAMLIPPGTHAPQPSQVSHVQRVPGAYEARGRVRYAAQPSGGAAVPGSGAATGGTVVTSAPGATWTTSLADLPPGPPAFASTLGQYHHVTHASARRGSGSGSGAQLPITVIKHLPVPVPLLSPGQAGAGAGGGYDTMGLSTLASTLESQSSGGLGRLPPVDELAALPDADLAVPDEALSVFDRILHPASSDSVQISDVSLHDWSSCHEVLAAVGVSTSGPASRTNSRASDELTAAPAPGGSSSHEEPSHGPPTPPAPLLRTPPAAVGVSPPASEPEVSSGEAGRAADEPAASEGQGESSSAADSARDSGSHMSAGSGASKPARRSGGGGGGKGKKGKKKGRGH